MEHYCNCGRRIEIGLHSNEGRFFTESLESSLWHTLPQIIGSGLQYYSLKREKKRFTSISLQHFLSSSFFIFFPLILVFCFLLGDAFAAPCCYSPLLQASRNRKKGGGLWKRITPLHKSSTGTFFVVRCWEGNEWEPGDFEIPPNYHRQQSYSLERKKIRAIERWGFFFFIVVMEKGRGVKYLYDCEEELKRRRVRDY